MSTNTNISRLVLVGAAVALLGGATALGGMARAAAAPQTTVQQAMAQRAMAHSVSVPPMVIQGSVLAIHGATVTVRTPAQRPPCGDGQICPMYIIAGTTFVVDTSTAAHEAANGRVIRDKIAAGEQVVVVGTTTGSSVKGVHRLRASVVERIVTTPRAQPMSKG